MALQFVTKISKHIKSVLAWTEKRKRKKRKEKKKSGYMMDKSEYINDGHDGVSHPCCQVFTRLAIGGVTEETKKPSSTLHSV